LQAAAVTATCLSYRDAAGLSYCDAACLSYCDAACLSYYDAAVSAACLSYTSDVAVDTMADYCNTLR
jgi:hypothetical protein